MTVHVSLERGGVGVTVWLFICTLNAYVGFSVTVCDGMITSLCFWVTL